MFDKVTKQLVRQIDPNGVLIPASFNDSKKLKLLAVVWKKPKMWFFGKAKYSPTHFTLNDLLEKGEIIPERDERDFLKCNATYKSSGSGSVDLGNEAVGLNVTGQGSSELHLSLDTLRKEDMDIPKLLKDSQGRKVNLGHGLIQQFLKGKIMLTLLKERIFTTCESAISYTGQEQGSCSSTLKGHPMKMAMKAKGELKCNSDLKMNIPAGTVFAYSVIKMSISSDGYIELCFEPDGIESDDISEDPDYSEVDGPWALQEIEEGYSLNSLKTALSDVQTRFCVLTDLTSECRSTLLLHLREILLDRPSLSVLVDRLEVLSSGEAPLLQNELLDNKSHFISEVLDLLKSEPHNSEQILVAMHMLLSAVEELTDAGLQLLESFCTSEGLRSLQDLVNLLMANSEPLSKDAIPVFLQKDDEFHRVVDLFKSCDVLVKREDDLMFADVTCEKGFLPFVLCIAISGLACLIDSNNESTGVCSQND
ncbi:gasdermin-E-like isoform X1 [Triplophysa rosa]|nr:gasdermin-E-like isoform X1 [Triplophysa rosa]XP_057210678.1 gasdermin-E-like isoform X1 [Triplophysa rosa]